MSDTVISTVKDYLTVQKISVVKEYLTTAEDQARRRKAMYMKDWEDRLDAFLEFNEREILDHACRLKASVAKKLAGERYDDFNEKRKQIEARKTDEETLEELKQIEEKAKKGDK